jgi:hypothetical protein
MQEKAVESKKLIDVVPKLSSARLRPVNQKTRIALVSFHNLFSSELQTAYLTINKNYLPKHFIEFVCFKYLNMFCLLSFAGLHFGRW